MTFFVRAVVTGFAISLGSALFKKVQPHIGLADEKDKKSESDAATKEAATDPDLQGA